MTEVKGENATVLDDRKGTSVTVHRNLLRRYVYPLAGLQLLGAATPTSPRSGPSAR